MEDDPLPPVGVAPNAFALDRGTPTHLAAGCEDCVDLITPELQRRGLIRLEYEGKTLRENLGLKPAANHNAPAA